MADRVGQQLGNYRLVRLLGEGGFAEVYLSEHIHLETQAAIKVLHTQLASDEVERFRTEARTIARLIHPHIVRVLDFGVEGKMPYLVMDYAPHGTLRKLHPKGSPLPLETIVSYVKQVADALQYAHDEHIIHRDIKPENLLLGRRNEALLSDFGIALVAQSSRYQSTQQMAGTMAYMAPEQIQGHPRPASDQYALGIVVYEWLSGDRPFHGSMMEIVAQHLAVPPLPLHEKVPMISSDVEQVVLTALAKDSHKRFASIQAFAQALEQASQTASPHAVPPPSEITSPRQPFPPPNAAAVILPKQSPPSTSVVTPSGQSSLPPEKVTPPSHSFPLPGMTLPSYTPSVLPPLTRESTPSAWPQQSNHPISRRAIIVGLAGVTGVSVVGGGLAWLTLSRRSQISSPVSHPPATFSPASSPIPTAASIPPGTTFFVCQGHTGAVYAASYSPDGRYLASGSYDHTVRVWDAQNGSHVSTYTGHTDGVWTLAWSPDSKRIASGSATINLGGDPTVQVCNAIDGGNAFLYRGHAGAVRAVVWSPDGTRIASGGDDSTVQVWDAAHGNLIYPSRRFSRPIYALAWSPDGTHIASESADGLVQVWNAANGNALSTYRGHASAGYVSYGALSWSPDSTRLASCAGPDDHTVQVWRAADGMPLSTYRGHSNGVSTVAWSPNGARIASGSGFFIGNPDNTVQVWLASNGNHLYTYHGHAAWVHTLSWSPNGTRIASGGEDTTVRVWQAV